MNAAVQIQIKNILEWTQGKIVNVDRLNLSRNFSFAGVGSDTRKSMEGLLFVALKGDVHDAHLFLDQAVKANAKGLLVHELPRDFDTTHVNIPIILVKDTLTALQQLAHFYRKTCPAQFVGVTGSNGKTSTKEFSAAIVAPYRKTHANKGSLNNHWGVPFNLLQVSVETEVVIVEMGMNHAREIEQLVSIADPDAVVCTMVGTAHIEHFGKIENIALAKEEIYQHARKNAKMIFNLDDPNTRKMFEKYGPAKSKAEVFTFSEKENQASVQMRVDHMTLDTMNVSGRVLSQEFRTQLNLFGYQNVTNLMAAACIGLSVGLTSEQVIRALPQCKTTWGRNQKLILKSGADLLFDAYNANPDSMKALLKNLEMMPGSSVVGVFGQMRELGATSAAAHFEIGQYVGRQNMKAVFFIGEDYESFVAGVKASDVHKQNVFAQKKWDASLQVHLENLVQKQDLVVMKASRGTKLEQFLTPEMIDPREWNYS